MQSCHLYMILWTFFCSGISGTVLALEKRESETKKTGFSCDGKFIPNEKLAKVVPEVCRKIRFVDEGKKYPSVYEGPLFDNSSLVHFAYPITDKRSYTSGEPAGPYRVVVDQGCNLAGVTSQVNSIKPKLCEMIGTPSPLIGIDLKTKLKDVMSEDRYKCGPKFFKMSTLSALVEKACPNVREGRTGVNKFPIKFYSELFSEKEQWLAPVKTKKIEGKYFVVMDKDCGLLGGIFSIQDHYVRCKEVRWGSSQTMMLVDLQGHT